MKDLTSSSARDRWMALRVPLALLALVALVHGRSIGFGYVDFDDWVYVVENPWIRKGLSWDQITWAFSTFTAANWHPLTWISLAADTSLFGDSAWGHHFMNVLLHGANAVLCFLVARTLTGQNWPSAFVAALFAIHPMHVESVAWVSERKDVLSSLFFFVSLIVYLRAQDRSNPATHPGLLAAFLLGLLAKPMLVSLPILLLLIDAWPLGRFRAEGPGLNAVFRSAWPLLKEKWALWALALGSGFVTLLAQHSHGAVAQAIRLPASWRLSNAVVSYAKYLQNLLFPKGLAVFYPHPTDTLSGAEISVSVVLLLLLTALFIRARKSRPYLLFGWIWFLVSLAPVIGLLQVGGQGMADRYAYISYFGLYLVVVLGSLEVGSRLGLTGWALPVIALGAIGSLAIAAVQQVGHWRNTETLFGRALQVTQRNWMAHERIAEANLRAGNWKGAISESERALALVSSRRGNHIRIGTALENLGDKESAIRAYRKALEGNSKSLKPAFRIGCLLVELHRPMEAIPFFEQVSKAQIGQIEPDPEQHFSAVHYACLTLGILSRENGLLVESQSYFRQAAAVRPSDLKARLNLAMVLGQSKKFAEAFTEIERCRELAPKNPAIPYFRGLLERSAGRSDRANIAFNQALALDPTFLPARKELAAKN